ncbi:MAG: prepilin-type N-terminal cleavage/methylation domain-containing protein [Sulfuricella sp.]|nr:prepilin-type N-terminal cleavage/methylation domain-containing protein [Sulfuricella sp.]
MKPTSFQQAHSGFTLVEMAIVLVIVGLLLGGLLMPLSTQIEQRRISETQKALDEIKEALIGFAVANKRFPRPATSATNGVENPATCANDAACSGFIPWATLGVTKLDAWGKIIRYSVTPDFANASITLITVANRKVLTRDGAGATSYLIGQAGACTATQQCAPVVIFSHGKQRLGTTDTGVAIPDDTATNLDEDANNIGPTDYYQRTPSENTAALMGGEFDDLVTWLSPNILFNRMVAAGQLP